MSASEASSDNPSLDDEFRETGGRFSKRLSDPLDARDDSLSKEGQN